MQKKTFVLKRFSLTYCTRKSCSHRFKNLSKFNEQKQIDFFNAFLVQLKFLLRSYLHLRSNAIIIKLQFSLINYDKFNLLSFQELRVVKK